MNPKTSLQNLFHEALARPDAGERARFLDDACGADTPMREQVERLLRAAEEVGGFMAQPSRNPAGLNPGQGGWAGNPLTEKPGDQIGRYKLLQQIGEGGFGTVWMAEQTEPVTRRVALKIIKVGMDTSEVIARFEAERQALAMMEHSNIAKVFDAGATDKGRPFFVMELVKGTPITQYCDEAQLGTRERLALFEDVCSAVSHAHEKGVIHRDLKPSNIMVTMHGEKPVVKVIDFGIAKATQGKLTDMTLFTRFEQFIGTPVYMSPEQAATSGLDTDVRSDIYSLGILLYELLTGTPPFDGKSLASAGYEEMRRIIREVEPPKPSTRLATMAGAERIALAKIRHIEPDQLRKLVAPDLDWIVMKAIEKDRSRRYDTAGGLALDIQRFLADEPVSATPPSAGYRLRSFARRNRTALRVAAVIALLLVTATAVSTWQAVRARQAERLAVERLAEVASERDAKEQARRDAEEARRDAEAISTYLAKVFQSPDPARDGRSVTVAELLDKAAHELESEFAGQPGQRAELQSVLAQTYEALGLYGKAVAVQEKVLGYHRTNSGPDHPDTVKALSGLAVHCARAGRLDEAIRLEEEALALMRGARGRDYSGVEWLMRGINMLASFYYEAGRTGEAIRTYEETLPQLLEQFGPENLETVPIMHNLAEFYVSTGRVPEALAMQEDVLKARRKLHPPEHPEILGAMHNLAMIYAAAGRNPEAVAMDEEVVALRRKVLGPEHPDTLKSMGNLAAGYSEAGRQDDALELQEKVVAGYRVAAEPTHPLALQAQHNLSVAYRRADRLSDAVRIEEQALAAMRRVLPANHPFLKDAMGNLADLYEMTGRESEAETVRDELAGMGSAPPAAGASPAATERSPFDR